jgi:hypothetical protein
VSDKSEAAVACLAAGVRFSLGIVHLRIVGSRIIGTPLAIWGSLPRRLERWRGLHATISGLGEYLAKTMPTLFAIDMLAGIDSIRSSNVIAIPESGSPADVKENAVALSLKLTPQELGTLDAAHPARSVDGLRSLLDRGKRWLRSFRNDL